MLISKLLVQLDWFYLLDVIWVKIYNFVNFLYSMYFLDAKVVAILKKYRQNINLI